MSVTPAPPEIIIDERLFYNFSLNVCDLTYYGALFTHANLRYNGETLTLDFPFVKTENDKLALKQYGIYSDPVTFEVKFSDSHHLTLSNEQSTVVLVKH